MAGNRSLGRLTLDLVARIGGFTQGMSQAERVAQDRSRRIQRTFTNLQRSIAGVFAFIGAGALVRSIVRATAEAEEAMGLLRNAVEQNGGAAGRTTERLAEMATELQRVTTYGDEAIMGAEQLLLRFQSIQGTNFDRALESTLDLAAAMRMDLQGAAKLVGKALESPVKGMTQLERSGVVLDKSQRDLIKRLVDTGRQAEAQQALLDGLEQRYHGAARAARDTFGGALQGLQNALGDLLEAKSGLPAVTDQINQLTDALSDPNTQKGIDNLVSGLLRIGGVGVEALSELGSLGEVLGRWQADAFGNLAMLDELEGDIIDIDRAINNSFMGKPLRFLFKNREELEALRKEIQASIDAINASYGDSARFASMDAPSGPLAAPIASEEFLKLEARLLEQIALFGKVGEAAKIAYQIQSGELDELSAKEQQRVLSLAGQIDGMTKAAEAAKEQEAAQRQLAQTYQSQQDAFIRQIYLTEEATELERLRFEINNGGLQGITQANRQYLEILAQEVDALKERAEAEAKIKAVIEETLTPLEKYQRRIEELNELLESGLGHQAYVRAVVKAQEELDAAVNKSNEFLLEAARNTQDILADTLFGAMEGKIDNIGKAFVQMLNQMVAQAIAADLARRIFGDISGDSVGGGGWLDKAFSWAGSLFGGGKAGGGHVAAGMLYRVNEQGMEALSIPGRDDYLMMGNRGGQVIAADRVGARGGTVNQTINVRGSVTQKSARQLALDSAQQQRLAGMRLA